jgi:hypothetical protein
VRTVELDSSDQCSALTLVQTLQLSTIRIFDHSKRKGFTIKPFDSERREGRKRAGSWPLS